MVFVQSMLYDHPFMDIIKDIVDITYSAYSFRLDYINATGDQMRTTFNRGMDPELYNIKVNDNTFAPMKIVDNPEKMAALIRQDLITSAIEALP